MRRLISIQQKLKAPKNQRNNFGGYMYRSAEDILEAVKPLLAEEKVVLIISDDIVNLGDRFYVRAIATLYDEEGKEIAHSSALAREADDKKGQDASQITGAASSYARKYALNGLLCIDDTKDADATNDHGKNDKPEAPKKTPAPEPKEQAKQDKSKNDEIVQKKVKECKDTIAKREKFVEDDAEYGSITRFANKIYSLGYEKDANEIMSLLEAKTEKDSIPDFN